jgi:hypothetical protein
MTALVLVMFGQTWYLTYLFRVTVYNGTIIWRMLHEHKHVCMWVGITQTHQGHFGSAMQRLLALALKVLTQPSRNIMIWCTLFTKHALSWSLLTSCGGFHVNCVDGFCSRSLRNLGHMTHLWFIHRSVNSVCSSIKCSSMTEWCVIAFHVQHFPLFWRNKLQKAWIYVDFFGDVEHDTGGGRNTCTLYLEASYGGKGNRINFLVNCCNLNLLFPFISLPHSLANPLCHIPVNGQTL